MTSHSLNLSRFIPFLRKIQMQTTFSMMQDMGTFVYTNKIGPSRKNFLEMGGKRRALARALGPAPHFLKKSFSRRSLFSVKAMDVSWLLNLKLGVKPESVSRMF